LWKCPQTNSAVHVMDNEEAKFILQAYRPHGQDAADPKMAEAMEQARRDPELGRWLEEEQEFDQAVSAKIRSVPVPVGLRETIIAGAKVVSVRSWWRQPSAWAVAAAITLLCGIMFFAPGANHEAFAADYVAGLTELDHKDHEVKSLCQWLAENNGHCNLNIPKSLRGMESVGCRVADWNGRKFSLICFRAVNEDLQPVIHLMVFDSDALPDLPTATAPRVKQRGDWAIASWTDGERSYILARVGNEASVRSIL
jgi:hypothetical protein